MFLSQRYKQFLYLQTFFNFFLIFFAFFLIFTPIIIKKLISMPVRKVPGGYQWGKSGKVYPTQEQASRQGRAIYASGYKENPKKTK